MTPTRPTAEGYRRLADFVAATREQDAPQRREVIHALRCAAEDAETLEVIRGYTIIPEDTQVRPDAASYVKPSEFADIVFRAILATKEGE